LEGSLPQTEVVKMFDVSQSIISNIKCRKVDKRHDNKIQKRTKK